MKKNATKIFKDLCVALKNINIENIGTISLCDTEIQLSESQEDLRKFFDKCHTFYDYSNPIKFLEAKWDTNSVFILILPHGTSLGFNCLVGRPYFDYPSFSVGGTFNKNLKFEDYFSYNKRDGKNKKRQEVSKQVFVREGLAVKGKKVYIGEYEFKREEFVFQSDSGRKAITNEEFLINLIKTSVIKSHYMDQIHIETLPDIEKRIVKVRVKYDVYILKRLIAWMDDDEYENFMSALTRKTTLCTFIVRDPSDKSGTEKLIERILVDEFRKKEMAFITAENETTYRQPTGVYIYDADYIEKKLKEPEFEDEIYGRTCDISTSSDLSRSDDPFNYLLIFHCNENQLSKLKKLIRRPLEFHELNIRKIDTSGREFKSVLNTLKFMNSIPSVERPELNMFTDLSWIDEYLRKDSIYFRNQLDYDANLNYVKPSHSNESDEHIYLKLIAYNHLKNIRKIRSNSIKVEEITDDGKIPDLQVSDKIAVEVETLRGIPNLNWLIRKKIMSKSRELSKFEEFWLVLPNFEIIIHFKELKNLLPRLKKLLKNKIIIYGVDFENKKLFTFKALYT